ncbi:MAG: FHA domain-containing protein [Planctomycetes bacterium]|nr:FHA domain-containing protein [Planctomycetota bacterium]
MKASLKILNGVDKGREFWMDSSMNVGRSSDNDIILSDETVSRQHVQIIKTKSGYGLKSLSPKDNVKVDGEAVGTCSLGGRHKIQVGRVLMRFKLTDPALKNSAASSTREPVVSSPSGRSTASGASQQRSGVSQRSGVVVGSAASQHEGVALGASGASQSGVAVPVESESQGDVLEAPSKFSPVILIKILFFIGVAYAAWHVLTNIEEIEMDPIILPYKAGEEHLIDLTPYLNRVRAKALPSKLKRNNSQLMRVKLTDPPLWILWLKTLEQGDCTVDILDSNNQLLLKFKFLIKGEVDPEADRFLRMELSEKDRLARARELMARAAIIEQEEPYAAVEFYQEALDYIETVNTSSPLYFDCREKLKEPEAALDARLKNLWSEANHYRKNKSYREALGFVEQILGLVSDPASLDHQRALIHKKYILRNIKK